MKSARLFLLLAALTACGSGKDRENGSVLDIEWGFSTSTMQMVNEAVDPYKCPSGWTALREELESEAKDDLVPLQSAYVRRFDTLYDFQVAAIQAHPLVNRAFSTIRISTCWPCWMANTQWQSEWQNEIIEAVTRLQASDWKIELTLSHHDSYPYAQHDENITDSGWVSNSAPIQFKNYVNEICQELKQAGYPAGSTIYLVNEPMAYLFNAYLGEGTWPPGGKKAGKSLAEALVNMREALYESASTIRSSGYKPAISKNVRHIINARNDEEKSLDYIFNWWLLDALVAGCVDDDFDGRCEENRQPSSLEIIGLTFYGTMAASDEKADFGLYYGEDENKIALPEMNFEPNADAFEEALYSLWERYPHLELRVSEIGFSASRTSTMISWLLDYKEVVEKLNKQEMIEASIQLHTLFKSAEFSPGDWVFHLVEGCGSSKCKLTPWGGALLNQLCPQEI